ncbi:MAG: TIGR04283 family arsenosugar biosynthesis glycosyltransferase [Hyphomicrobiaceae bacterium]
MITAVIPTLNAEVGLSETLSALVPAAVEGLVRQVVIADGGSCDRTLAIADGAGADIVGSEPGRGTQLRAGVATARYPWLLFLHADTVLDPGWIREAGHFMERIDSGKGPSAAAVFRFALDDRGIGPRMIEIGVSLRCALFGLPYGDQGLLIRRDLYDAAGGYRALPLMEDVDLVRRIGRRRLVVLRTSAVTSAVRYRQDGYLRRMVRNLSCLTLYYLRVPLPTIVRLYGAGTSARR